ncbi:unnamed protein product [Psylliodes chrysocephalus]|uniref:Tesmin/TSO1-like CXC domain-containing protein n=1 Tax=Psylliodes chrysocephalus TaxID=3402493 RepID=A0A9P0GNY9_9CUCU|nr:unnamed protein product [Psylliodes chrysocephala]
MALKVLLFLMATMKVSTVRRMQNILEESNKAKKYVDIVVSDSIFPSCTQSEFLKNTSNKTNFISFLAVKLTAAKFKVQISPGDADTHIVNTAVIFCTENKKGVIVGEDTDLLVIIITVVRIYGKLSGAAKQHSYRVFHQVQSWRGVQLPATEWGWMKKEGQLLPAPTLEPLAPETILKLVFCNCKTDCAQRCDCRRRGLPCTPMCGKCNSEACSNRPFMVVDGEEQLEVQECSLEKDYITDPNEPGPSRLSN